MKSGELKLIMHLRNDARKSLSLIAREINVPVTTLFTMLQELESRLITKYACLVDFHTLGYDIRVCVAIKCFESNKEKVRKFIIESKNVNSVFRTNNGFDFLFEAVFISISALGEFLEELDNFKLKKRNIYHIIEEYKKEELLTKEEHLRLFIGN